MPATAGNLSARSPGQGIFWITASGLSKGKLKEKDFLPITLAEGLPVKKSSLKPSAETSIHHAIYQADPEANACIHVHLPVSVALQFSVDEKNPSQFVSLPNLEIWKAFGIWKERPDLEMLVIHNFLDVAKISALLLSEMRSKNYALPFFLIQNHGLTVWGKDVEEASKNLEAVEHAFQVMWLRSSLR